MAGLANALESQPSSWVAMFIEAGGIEGLVYLVNNTVLKTRVSQEDKDVLFHALASIKILLGVRYCWLSDDKIVSYAAFSLWLAAFRSQPLNNTG